MIVDDNMQTVALMSQVLIFLGHDPVGINHWQEAEMHLAQDMPDMLLMDLRMPEIDGYQAIRRARAMPQANGLPIVVLTADPKREVELQITEAGGDAVYSKPISMADLDSAIQSFTNGSRNGH